VAAMFWPSFSALFESPDFSFEKNAESAMG